MTVFPSHDMHAVIANDLALGVGKELGITKAEIKKAISEKAVNKKTQSGNATTLSDCVFLFSAYRDWETDRKSVV